MCGKRAKYCRKVALHLAAKQVLGPNTQGKMPSQRQMQQIAMLSAAMVKHVKRAWMRRNDPRLGKVRPGWRRHQRKWAKVA